LILIAAAWKWSHPESGISGDISPGCLETPVHDVLN
jgi:hypothetical protein